MSQIVIWWHYLKLYRDNKGEAGLNYTLSQLLNRLEAVPNWKGVFLKWPCDLLQSYAEETNGPIGNDNCTGRRRD